MKTSTTVIIIIGAVVVVLGGLLILGAAGSTIPDVRYNYTTELSEGFQGDFSYVTPEPGNVFVIVVIHAYNDYVSGGVSMSPLTWAWRTIAGNIEYTSSIHTFSHPMYKSGSIVKGGNERFVIVFEIPKEYGSTYTIKEQYQWGYEKVVRDTSIIV